MKAKKNTNPKNKYKTRSKKSTKKVSVTKAPCRKIRVNKLSKVRPTTMMMKMAIIWLKNLKRRWRTKLLQAQWLHKHPRLL
jgi:hypothetical protein